MADAVIDGGKLIRESVTLKVKLPKALGLRIRLCCLLMRVAAWIGGTGFDVEVVATKIDLGLG